MENQNLGMMVSCYRTGELGDCTNRQYYKGDDAHLVGISAIHHRAIILGAGPGTQIFEPDETKPALYFAENRKLQRKAVFPTQEAANAWADGNHTGFMFGGNFVYTSDSRFPAKHPIHVYDRKE